jgi:hypothetical protein
MADTLFYVNSDTCFIPKMPKMGITLGITRANEENSTITMTKSAGSILLCAHKSYHYLPIIGAPILLRDTPSKEILDTV